LSHHDNKSFQQTPGFAAQKTFAGAIHLKTERLHLCKIAAAKAIDRTAYQRLPVAPNAAPVERTIDRSTAYDIALQIGE
jgi:hypothetical protein